LFSYELIPLRLLFFPLGDSIYIQVSLSAGSSDKTLPIRCASSGVIGRQIENATAFYTFIHLDNFWKEAIIRKKGSGVRLPFCNSFLLIALPDLVISLSSSLSLLAVTPIIALTPWFKIVSPVLITTIC
jgi:hypothetical protein